MAAPALPLFHLYGDSPDNQAFDFIHIETIASRASVNDWVIHAHRHGNLSQILFVARGGGEMIFETATIPFTAPSAVLVPSTVAHGFRFEPGATDGWVVSFTDDVGSAMGNHSDAAWARLRALAVDPVIPLATPEEGKRVAELCAELHQD
jgi:AraC family transcriptional regulator, transcriptional activator of pobA